MTQSADQLVGRVAELASLDARLDELARGVAGALELAGEPGIGKTRLLAELGARADARGQLVLSGSASELELELPFGVFVDALDEYVQALEPGRLAALDDGTRAELAHVLPSFPERDAVGAALADERYRTHRAVRRLLEVLAARQPLVLLLDDLHWADSGSVELLGSLLRHPPGAPVLIALAVRPRQLPVRLSASRERARRGGTLARFELGALSAQETRELLGTTIGGGVAAALHDQSGGNPFYVQQLARALHRRLDAMPAAAELSLAGIDVPPTVAAALTEELALLDGDVRRVLEGAAVAGDPFEPELAAAAASVPERAAMDALDALLARDVVRPTDVPRRFRFRHPLIRQAVYESAPAGWRLGAHERTAAALAARGAPAAARAHHVEHAGRHGDDAAIAVLRQAGDAVAERNPAGAAHWYAAALRLVPETEPPARRLELLRPLADALAATGRFAEARTALLDGLAIAPADERPALAAACARVEQLLGRHEEAHARLERTLAEHGEAGSAEAASLMIDLALGAIYRLDFETSREWATRALDAARPLGERPLTAAATAALATAGAFAGPRADAERHCSQAAALVDAMPDRELALRLDAVSLVTVAEAYLDRFEDGAAHGTRGLALARETGQGELLPTLLPALNSCLLPLGRLAEASELLDGGIEGARLSGNTQALAWNLMNRALNALVAGDLETGLRSAEESVELSRELDESMVAAYAGVALGFARIELGDSARGIELAVTHGGGEDLPVFGGGWRAWFLEWLSRGQLAAGRQDDAARTAESAAAVAETTGLGFARVVAGRAAASLALAAGDAAGAAEHALSAAALADELGAQVEAGLSRTVAGRALVEARRPAEAAALLERAAAALDGAGAQRHRDAAERELGKLGRRRARRTRRVAANGSGIASLTERELQVARLIADRKTNPQIAAELFLSPKTVESHVRNLFHKLSVSSRVEVARAVERADRPVA